MTAKRFTLFDDGETIFDNETVAEDGGKQIYWVVEYGQRVKVVELLNELHEENEYLCEKIKENEWHWNTIDEDRDVWIYKCKTLEEENKQLRIEKDTAQKQHSYELDKKLQYKSKLIDLKKENEQLKSTIKDVVELLSEEVDLFSDKALEHDICAYIELRELDNKDAYYMAISTKKAIQMLKGDLE